MLYLWSADNLLIRVLANGNWSGRSKEVLCYIIGPRWDQGEISDFAETFENETLQSLCVFKTKFLTLTFTILDFFMDLNKKNHILMD